MGALADPQPRTLLTTDQVPHAQAFAYWREMICAIFVKLRAQPLVTEQFRGSISRLTLAELELSKVSASAQHVERTARLIADASDAYLLASIQVSGTGRVEQDGRCAELTPGDMAFYDSTRPYALHFDDAFEQVVVQVRRSHCDIQQTRSLTARTLGAASPGAAVAAFFRTLADSAPTEHSYSVLAPQATALLDTAAAYADQRRPTAQARDAAARQRVDRYMRQNLADPRLDAETIAAACHMSRRTLYRIVGADGVARSLRKIRMDRARLLLGEPRQSMSAIAAACGFDSESGFYRAFRQLTGQTPADYRAMIGQSFDTSESGTSGH